MDERITLRAFCDQSKKNTWQCHDGWTVKKRPETALPMYEVSKIGRGRILLSRAELGRLLDMQAMGLHGNSEVMRGGEI